MLDFIRGRVKMKPKVKWYSFSFSMKKGNIEKYKPFLDYISKNYYPEFLSISQMLWYDYMKDKPIPVIEFKAPCIDPIDVMNDFVETFSKQLVTGGAQPYKWMKDPVLTATKLVEIYRRHHELEERKKKEGWKK